MKKNIGNNLILPLIGAGIFMNSGVDNGLMADTMKSYLLSNISAPHIETVLTESDLLDIISVNSAVESGTRERQRKPRRVDQQVFFLNFETIGAPTFDVLIFSEEAFFTGNLEVFGTFPDYVFTQENKQNIQQRLEADFKGFDIVFTQKKPISGDFSTIFFSDNDDVDITLELETGFSFSDLLGADSDFLNRDKNDTVVVDGTSLQFTALTASSPAEFTAFTGVPVETTIEDALSGAMVNNVANSAAREVLNLMGGLPQDAFGPPGAGIPDFITREAFVPTYSGPQNATESLLHLADSVSNDFININSDLFLSERSALRLQLTQRISNGRFKITEEDRSGSNASQDIRLRGVPLPNTIITGQNKGAALKARAAVIFASIDDIGEKDRYQFRANAGDVITIESFPEIPFDLDGSIIVNLSLSIINSDGSLTEVAANLAALDRVDAFILDASLPSDGTYVLEVDAPDTYIGFGSGPDSNSFGFESFSLEEDGLTNLRTGKYNLILYTIEAIS